MWQFGFSGYDFGADFFSHMVFQTRAVFEYFHTAWAFPSVMGDMGQFMPFFAGQFEERLFTDLTTMPLFFLVNFQNMPKEQRCENTIVLSNIEFFIH